MKYVVDASVAISAARNTEQSHQESTEFFERAIIGGAELLLPPLFQIEVVATLCRAGGSLRAAAAFIDSIMIPPARVVVMGPRAALRAQEIAALYRLRGADAVYASTAHQHNATLVSLDNEHLLRVPFACRPRNAVV
jgi:predicted nucleic acid-binding protein